MSVNDLRLIFNSAVIDLFAVGNHLLLILLILTLLLFQLGVFIYFVCSDPTDLSLLALNGYGI